MMFFDAVELIAKLPRQQIREVSITKKTDFVTNWSDDEIEKCGKR